MEFDSLPHYNINPSEEGSYVFISSSGITYFVDFVESKHFNYPGIVYEFSFEPVTIKRSRFDIKIRNTVIKAVWQVIEKDNTSAIVFVCDSMDKKQLARKRLFDKWFNTLKTNEFEKFDAELHIGDNEVYYNSLIILANNPFKKQLIDSYSEVLELYSK